MMSLKIFKLSFLVCILTASPVQQAIADNHNNVIDISVVEAQMGVDIGELTPRDPSDPNEFNIRNLTVDTNKLRVLVLFDVTTVGGSTKTKQLGKFSLRADQTIDSRLGMLMVLRDVISNPDLRVFLTLKRDLGEIDTIESVSLSRTN